MPSRAADRSVLALHDIRDTIVLARQFVSGLTKVGFSDDRKTVYAVTRCLEIISEASRRLAPAVRERHPELPWNSIMGAGNVYRHDYENVVDEIVWQTIEHSLEPLLRAVEAELARPADKS